MVVILMMSAKLAILDLLKRKVSWNKGYHVIIFCPRRHQQTFMTCSNYIVDVVMWLKFGNSNISMRDVIIISVL